MNKIFETLKIAGKDFMADRCLSHSAALSFYAVTALPPLVIIILNVVGLVYDSQTALDQLTREITSLFGQNTADLVREIGRTRESSEQKVATAVGTATLILAASGFFGQLQDALNDAWEVRVKPNAGWLITIRKRLLSMTAVLGTAFLMLVSLLLSTLTAALGTKIEDLLGIDVALVSLAQIPITLAVIGVLFSAIFKTLPDAQVAWKQAFRGGFFAATVFLLGKFAFSLYLGSSNPGDAYGSAGSLVLLLFWIYFSTNVLLFGAELTQALSKAQGQSVQPQPHAEQVEEVVVGENDDSPSLG